jgi:hypothetical protein
MHCNPDQKRDCEQCSIYLKRAKYTEGTVYKLIWEDGFRDLWDIPAFVYAVYEGEVDLDINGWKVRCHKFVEHRQDKSTRVHHLNINGDVAKAIIATTTKIIKEEKVMRTGRQTFEEVRRQTSFMEDEYQRLMYGTALHGDLNEEERLDLARYCQSLGIEEADELINRVEDPGLTASLVLAIFKYGKKFDYEAHPDVIEDIMDQLQEAGNSNGRISQLHTKICEDQTLTKEELRDVRDELLGNEDYYKTMYLGYKKVLREMAKDIAEDTDSLVKREIMEQVQIMTEAMGKISSLWAEHMEVPGLNANMTTYYPFSESLDEIYCKTIGWKQDIEAEFGNMVCEGWACPKCGERDMDVLIPLDGYEPEEGTSLSDQGDGLDLTKDVYCTNCRYSYNVPVVLKKA